MEPRRVESGPVEVSEVKIRLVDEGDDGLVGWASCVVNGALYLNNIAIRRGCDGEFVLTYPSKRSRSDQKYFYFNPITREAKRAIDEAILGKLERRERTWPA
ncbi:MAG: septation protein SpoVG family protein [Planctomycetes bacterium]|nr:septation protein SpoVG family protein [Planctomycetota bacterium]